MNIKLLVICVLYFGRFVHTSANETKSLNYICTDELSVDSLNNLIGIPIKWDKTVLLLGELHGSNEMAAFAYQLTTAFTKNDIPVNFLLEISPEMLGNFQKNKDSLSLAQSPLFTNNMDGRGSQAWFDLILKLSAMRDVQLSFIENYKSFPDCVDKDSVLYFNTKETLKHKTEKKAVTIIYSGNWHNQTQCQKGDNLRTLLSKDKSLSKFSFVSVGYLFDRGQINANIGEGLQLVDLPSSESPYNSISCNQGVLMKNLNENGLPYELLYFTKEVTPSFSIGE